MQRETDTLLVGLTVGTTKTTAIVAERDPRSPDVQVLSMGFSPSSGLSKGVIGNLKEATRSVIHAVREAENIADRKVRSAIVAFNSLDVHSVTTSGMVALGGPAPDRVEVADLERVIQAAQSLLELSKNTLSVHTIPVRYLLDGRPVDEPLNMTGMRLEMELQTVSVPMTYVRNVINCVMEAGIRVEGLVLKPLASSLGALKEEEMRVGCISISVGGGTTGIVLYQSGRPSKIMSIPIGGDQVNSDLATELHISLREAEDLKKRLFTDSVDSFENMGIDPYRALKIISARLEELFMVYVREALADFPPQLFPAGVVLSGGVAQTPDIDRLVAEALGMKVRIANPNDLYVMPYGRENDPSYASAAGLLRYLVYRRRHSHLFIEPSSMELGLAPVPSFAGEGLPDDIRVSGASGREHSGRSLKDFLQSLSEHFKELF